MGASRTHPIEVLARAGYGARGVVYLLIGGLAFSAGLQGTGGAPDSDSHGALLSIVGEPLGTTALVLIALGLCGYALWRAAQAILDADGHGTDAKGLAVRGGLMVSAVTHTLLAVFAIQLVVGVASGGGSSAQDWTAWLMRQVAGIWLVALVGLAIVGAGVAQAWKGWTEGYRKHMVLPEKTWLPPVCRFGLLARGVVFGIIGGFLILAAWRADPSEAGGLGMAMATLHAQAYGRFLFVIVALGLLAFGVYSILEGMYRRIDTPEELTQHSPAGVRS